MSNDPSPIGNSEATNDSVTDDTTAAPPLSPAETSRRVFLKYVGAGVAAASLPTLEACTVDSAPVVGTPAPFDVEAALTNATWVDVMRKDDLLAFSLGLVNLVVESRARMAPPAGLALKGDLWLQRDAAGPAYLIVRFQSQHIAEQAFDPNDLPKGGRIAVDARIAKESRVVFAVPAAVTAIPFELEPLLAAIATYPLSVAPNATPQPADTTLVRAPGFGGLTLATSLAATKLPTGDAIDASLVLARARRGARSFAAMNPDVSPALGHAGLRIDAAGTPSPTPTTSPTVSPIPVPVPAPIVKPRQPTDLETAIELPFRLQISPNSYARFAHESTATAMGAQSRVELWHTRLTTPEAWQKTIRALWTRDITFDADWANDIGYSGEPGLEPFKSALYDDDRGDIVHLTTNLTLKDDLGKQRARAVDANALMLSTLGGWLDAHGKWKDPPGWNPANPDAPGNDPGLVAWDHVAAMARDNYVRVVRFGYLWPFGHKCVFVRVTERKFADAGADTPYLWQKEYLVVKEPVRTYDTLPGPLARGFPFTSVRFKTLVTPPLAPLTTTPNGPKLGGSFTSSMWAQNLADNKAFAWEVQAFDHEGNEHAFTTSAIWVAYADAMSMIANPAMVNELQNDWTSKLDGSSPRWQSNLKLQRVSYGSPKKPDDTRYSTAAMGAVGQMLAAPIKGEAPFVPQLGVARLDIDTIRGITGSQDPQPFAYNTTYLANGFDGGANSGEVVLDFSTKYDGAATKPKLDVHKMTHKSGGFIAPSLAVSGVSRSHGIISGSTSNFAGGSSFNPSDFFDLGDAAKLFGCIKISDILEGLGVGTDFFKQAPKFITQGLQAIEEVLDLVKIVNGLGGDLNDDITALSAQIPYLPPAPAPDPNNPPAAPFDLGLFNRLKSKAGALGKTASDMTSYVTQLQTAIGTTQTKAQAVADAVSGAITAIANGTGNADTLAQAISDALDAANTAFGTLSSLLGTLPLPVDGGTLAQATKSIDSVASWLATNAGKVKDIATAFLSAEDAIKNLHIKLDWSPKLAPWPKNYAIFWPNDLHGFHIGVEIRGKESGGQPAGAEVYASLVDFELRLLGQNPVMKLEFDKLVFKVGSNSKPDIDCVFRGLHFGGALSFVETLRNIIPLDGFSDPPNVSVTTEGLSASFGLPLPNIAVGVFSLENISFNAGFQIPFIGKSLSVDFSFCTRESPFVLTVCMLGGGGFFGITITPDGVQKLEVSLEATACLAIDFGVASGSISIAVGIYFCIENGDCKLSGYVKFRGSVSVLGIINASIELYMELDYESATKKVIGKASLEIHVSVLCFGFTVSLHVERKFKGGNDDPTFRQLMEPQGTFTPWTDYCDAFVPLSAA